MRNERSQAEMHLAVQAFADVLRVERLLERKRKALEAAVVRLPEEDKAQYVQTTEKMARDADDRATEELPPAERRILEDHERRRKYDLV